MDNRWIGWCKEANHDKVWMIVQLNGNPHSGKYVTVWGRRGKKMQTKIHDCLTTREKNKLIFSKEGKGYKEIQEKDLDSVYPEFQKDLEKTTVWALLSA
jgi:predicted DNA-binding WGR domain protein